MYSGRERLAEYRKRSKLNQRELARLIGITDAYLSQVLSGKRFPGRENALLIERLTGVPVESWSEPRRGKTDRTKRATTETANVSR
jgi:transcriptional regulator with XRE-family HTH domain